MRNIIGAGGIGKYDIHPGSVRVEPGIHESATLNTGCPAGKRRGGQGDDGYVTVYRRQWRIAGNDNRLRSACSQFIDEGRLTRVEYLVAIGIDERRAGRRIVGVCQGREYEAPDRLRCR